MKRLFSTIALALCAAASALTVEQYSPTPGAEFAAGSGGGLRAAEVFSDVSGGTAKLERLLAVNVYTNAEEILTSTQVVFTVVFTNTVDDIVFTNVYPTTVGVKPPLHCSVIASNIVQNVTATTNTWPVLKEVLAEKQTIFDGTLSGHVFTNALSGVYLLQGDRLIFSGSAATNGWLRLILE